MFSNISAKIKNTTEKIKPQVKRHMIFHCTLTTITMFGICFF